MRHRPSRFAYTIHPWIASLYVDCDAWEVEDGCPDNPGLLKCPSAEDIAKFDQAVKQGDILWAASPMDLDAGVVGEPGFFADPMEIASNLNRRYSTSERPRASRNVDAQARGES